jgi:hypothetical protein
MLPKCSRPAPDGPASGTLPPRVTHRKVAGVVASRLDESLRHARVVRLAAMKALFEQPQRKVFPYSRIATRLARLIGEKAVMARLSDTILQRAGIAH